MPPFGITRRALGSAFFVVLIADNSRVVIAPSEAVAGSASVTDTYSAVANAEDIARQWPDGREMPALLRAVVAYVKDKPWMSLGATRLVGDRMDDYWIENGADLWRDFGIFMRLPDGSRVAQWFRDGQTGEPPVVLIGSEGEQVVLAPNLEAFLAVWALAHFDDNGALVAEGVPVGLPSDLIRSDDEDEDDDPVADGRPAFAAFLTQMLERPVAQLITAKQSDAGFETFFSEWGHAARAEISANPNLQQMAKILDAYVPRGKQPWQRANFRISAIGDRIEIGGNGDPRKPLNEAEAAALRPLIARERERRAAGSHAPRGLWHSAAINLYPDGLCQLQCDWASAPKFFNGPAATAAEFLRDQQRFPKGERWIEPWMKELP
ncbi:MAG: hypothetical protein ABL897_10780 [Hyphomicrobium sp.]